MTEAHRPPSAGWRHASPTAIALTLLLAAGFTAAAAADDWQSVNVDHTAIKIHEPTRLRQLDPVFQQLFLPDMDEDLKLTSTIQLFPVDPTLLGIPRARGRARVNMVCFDAEGRDRNLGRVNRRFDRDGNIAVAMRIPAADNCENVILQWEFLKNFQLPAELSIEVDSALEIVDPQAPGSCFGRTNLCLNDDRFRVEVEWRDFNGSRGPGIAFPRSDDAGTFFFFNPDNTELLLKVIDGCRFNDHFWVFAAATTDVEYTLRVTDTQTNQSRVYDNPLGRPAPAIQDTQAFATCP